MRLVPTIQAKLSLICGLCDNPLGGCVGEPIGEMMLMGVVTKRDGKFLHCPHCNARLGDEWDPLVQARCRDYERGLLDIEDVEIEVEA
jgi:hypothetical protein